MAEKPKTMNCFFCNHPHNRYKDLKRFSHSGRPIQDAHFRVPNEEGMQSCLTQPPSVVLFRKMSTSVNTDLSLSGKITARWSILYSQFPQEILTI